VFDLFFTTRPDGTGLGLATVKKSIESHGGTVAVAYTGPRGTAFRIELPASAGSAPSVRAAASR
ncbi:MAG: ATP-binding protein, partial [Proteobacteria bacterium]|nr:ATP-binding protein [Pseudomonadota bacterium]